MTKINGYVKELNVKDRINLFKTVIIIHKFVSKIKLSLAEESVLAYFGAYKDENDINKIILKDKVVGSAQVLYNVRHSLKRKNLLYVDEENRLKIADSLNIDIGNNNKSFVLIKINIQDV